MSRYIDADLLQEDFKEDHGGKRSLMIDTQPTADVVEADKAQKEIDYWHDKAQSYEQTILKLSLNKADVVEVVRCKDCVMCVEYMGNMFCGYQSFLSNPAGVSANDYCSRGERRE